MISYMNSVIVSLFAFGLLVLLTAACCTTTLRYAPQTQPEPHNGFPFRRESPYPTVTSAVWNPAFSNFAVLHPLFQQPSVSFFLLHPHQIGTWAYDLFDTQGEGSWLNATRPPPPTSRTSRFLLVHTLITASTTLLQPLPLLLPAVATPASKLCITTIKSTCRQYTSFLSSLHTSSVFLPKSER